MRYLIHLLIVVGVCCWVSPQSKEALRVDELSSEERQYNAQSRAESNVEKAANKKNGLKSILGEEELS